MDEHGFEARLRHLEHILVGQQTAYLSRATKVSLLQRVDTLRKELQRVFKSNKGVQDFVDKYDVHAKLLNPTHSTFLMERELLSPETKLDLILAANEDMETFAKQVKLVKSLEHVVSSATLEAFQPLEPELLHLQVAHLEQTKTLEQLTLTLSTLMDNYSRHINTLSEIFISWDDILATMESHVSVLERERSTVQ